MNASPTIYDEDVRLQTTTTATPAECECVNWCRDGLHVREEMLAGHHYRCPKFEAEFRRRAMELIERLRDNMRKWGNEEDGVPDFAWKAFCDAEAVAGPTKAGKAANEEILEVLKRLVGLSYRTLNFSVEGLLDLEKAEAVIEKATWKKVTT